MKRLSTSLLVAVLTASLSMTDVHAKRLGGARNMGKQSAPASAPAASPGAAPAVPAAPAAPAAQRTAPAATPAQAAATGGRSRWLGPLAGVAAGLGLAALLSHFGLADELAAVVGQFLLIGGIVLLGVMAWRLLRRRPTPSRLQPAYAARDLGPNTMSDLGRETVVHPQPSAPLRFDATLHPSDRVRPGLKASSYGIPAGFDANAFAEQAKRHFVALQEAWDRSDLKTLAEYTSPAMYREIEAQLRGRGEGGNQTDVVTLVAEVLGVTSDQHEHTASVRFHGLLREELDGSAQAFDEVWNLTKPVDGKAGWVLAGIQQVQIEPDYSSIA